LENRIEIPFFNLAMKPFYQWDQQWFLLTAGDYAAGKFNTMTVSWGSLGIVWGRPFMQVFVRPVRHTYQFIDTYDTFTLCAFPERYRNDLDLLGTKSGRDGDKIAETKLTPMASRKVAAPGFAEAELIVECRKIYWSDIKPEHFLDPTVEDNYPMRDYHRTYYGEVLSIMGTAAYQR